MPDEVTQTSTLAKIDLTYRGCSGSFLALT